MPKPYNHRDKYFLKAKADGYKARSVYKLEQIQARLPLLKKGNAVLDLGAYPGSFAQYTRKVIGPGAPLVLVDLQPVAIDEPNTVVMEGDIFDERVLEQIMADERFAQGFDVVVSDVAPKTTGIKDVDHGNSIELCERVLEIADKVLKPGGNVLMKVFVGSDYDGFYGEVKRRYAKVKAIKPDATRDRSREVFVVGMGKKG